MFDPVGRYWDNESLEHIYGEFEADFYQGNTLRGC